MRRLLAILPLLALAGCFSPDEPLCELWWTPFSGHENGALLDRGRH